MWVNCKSSLRLLQVPGSAGESRRLIRVEQDAAKDEEGEVEKTGSEDGSGASTPPVSAGSWPPLRNGALCANGLMRCIVQIQDICDLHYLLLASTCHRAGDVPSSGDYVSAEESDGAVEAAADTQGRPQRGTLRGKAAAAWLQGAAASAVGGWEGGGGVLQPGASRRAPKRQYDEWDQAYDAGHVRKVCVAKLLDTYATCVGVGQAASGGAGCARQQAF